MIMNEAERRKKKWIEYNKFNEHKNGKSTITCERKKNEVQTLRTNRRDAHTGTTTKHALTGEHAD